MNIRQGRLFLSVDDEQYLRKSEMDGCYIWTTDLPESVLSDREVYERYKDLKYVEDDFRLFKTTFLDVRPIFVRKEESTRGHLLVVMLAHMILRELRRRWVNLDKTVYEALTELSLICRNTINFSGGQTLTCIPEPNETMVRLLKSAKITLPKSLEEVKVSVVTRRKVRKAATH